MKLQIRKCQSEMSLTVVTLQLQSSLEIFYSLAGLPKIVQHESAIHVSGRHFRIALQGKRKILQS